MLPTRILTILMASMIISSLGCTGSRLGNLVTRSDYQTLEELEAADAIASTEASEEPEEASRSRFSSLLTRNRDAETEENDTEPQKRRSIFSFASLFNRNPDDSALEPDPFVEAENASTPEAVAARTESGAASQKKAAGQGSDEQNMVKSITAAQAERLVAEAAEAEDTAENLFREAAAAVAEAEAATEQALLPKIQPASPSTVEKSFADFVASQQNQTASTSQPAVKETVEPLVVTAETPNVNPFAATTVDTDRTTKTPTTSTSKSAFDDLLGDLTPAEKPVTGNNESPDQFADLEDFMPSGKQQTPAEAVAEPRSFDDFFTGQKSLTPVPDRTPAPDRTQIANRTPAGNEEITPTAMSGTDDPFLAASRSHGFSDLERQDPWAAFRQKQTPASAAGTAPKASEFGSDTDDQVSWADLAVDPVVEASPQRQATDFSTTGESPADLASSQENVSPFHKVSSSSEVAEPGAAGAVPASPFDDSLRPGLVIPAENTQPAPITDTEDLFSNAISASGSGAETLDDDPFADATGTTAAQPAAAAPEASGSAGISTRTWFLLLACVIVALLLFMPERQNRRNA
ncbi:MAG: hypothetical protein RIK87_00500 [Fuerstiella sp.]